MIEENIQKDNRERLNNDMFNMIQDIEHVKVALSKLEEDYSTYDIEKEFGDVTIILNRIMRLKKDVSTAISDYFVESYQSNDDKIYEEIGKTYANLSSFFDDLKIMHNKLKSSFLNQQHIKKAKIDWEKLMREIEIMQRLCRDLPPSTGH